MRGSKFISVSLVILLTFSFQMFCFADDSTTTNSSGSILDLSSLPKPVTTSRFDKHTSTEKLAAILVEFNDISFQNESAYKNLIFGDSGLTLNTYYKSQSNNKFYFTPIEESYGTANDGIIKIKIDSNYPFTSVSNNNAVRDTFDKVMTSCENYIKFSDYDTNKDGTINQTELAFLLMIPTIDGDVKYSGCGDFMKKLHFQTSDDLMITSNTAVRSVPSQTKDTDEDKLKIQSQLGVLSHEMGHVLSLIDLYDTTYNKTTEKKDFGVDNASLMMGASGTIKATPSELDPMSMSLIGFVEPKVIDTSGEYELYSLDTGKFNVFKIPTSNSNEFFLLENRQYNWLNTLCNANVDLSSLKKGETGIGIWHIDLSKSGNNEINHKFIDVEEVEDYSKITQTNNAGEKIKGRVFFDKDDGFGPDTVPNSNLYDGTATGVKITVLSDSGSSMKVKIELNSTGSSDTSTETKTQYTVTTNYTGASSEIASTSQAVDYDGSVTITVPAVDGYEVESVKNSETAVQASADGSYVINNVKADATVTVTYKKVQYTVTTNYTGTSSEIASTSQAVDYDGSATITVPAVDGYEVESVKNSETAVQASADGSYVINNVKADATVTVTYKKNTENTNNNANIPQPVKPQPVKPQPVKPQPVKPQPVKPQPVKPQPVKPQPVKPQPVKPQPVKPQPIIPQLSLPNIAIQHPIITLK